jgi:hypothetical protein
MEPILDRLAALHLNTVLAPLYWELIEPREGQFDFALLDGLVQGARRRGLHLVLLWFGTLKNAISCYTPEWVKTDLRRFPRAESVPGRSSWTVSPFCEEAARCDARAFAAVMRRIRELDGEAHTVVMMQVENEPGILNAPRDTCPLAQAAFAAPVPAELFAYLDARRAALLPELDAIWAAGGRRASGTWAQVFGEGADEVFMAWHTGQFLERVAAAGRAEYDLPMFANAWLIQGPGYKPGQYPSGGPVSKMMDVWRAAAPHIDLLAPDIYHQDFRAMCASYTRSGNPLLIPEARHEPVAAANALYAFGRHDAVGFSPFGIDDVTPPHPLIETYRTLGGMAGLIVEAQGTGRMTAFLQQADREQWQAILDGARFRARTSRTLAECRVPGAAILLSLGSGEFVAAGRNLLLTFEPVDPVLHTAELVYLDEGVYENNQWRTGHRLNGDETAHGTGVLLGEALQTCRFRLHTYR